MAYGQTITWPAAAAPTPGNPWLWSRRADLLWVCGGAFFLFLAVAAPLALAWAPLGKVLGAFFLHASILVNYPHFVATYQVILLERKTRPWAFRTMIVTTPLMVAVAVVVGLYPDLLWGLFLRFYLTWSAHHFAAQHFGMAAMYSAREGRPLPDREKLWLQAAFLGVGAFMMIAANTVGGDPTAANRVAGLQQDGGDYAIPIAQFPAWAYHAGLLLVVASIAAFAVAERRHARRTGKSFGLSVWMLFATNLVWFVTPMLRFGNEPWMNANLALCLLGAPPFFHSAQYLAVTGWRSRTNGPIRPIWLFAGLVAGGYLLFNVLPTPLSWATRDDSAGLVRSILIIVAVGNLHHFWVDGLIWRRKRAPLATAGGAPPAAPAA